jgi:hypothetical protein
MKLISRKNFFLILLMFSLAMTAGALLAQVYKIIDEDGNVTYTDQPPADGSKPIELRPISVIEAPIYATAPQADEESAEGEDGKEMSLKYLRENYKDFAIIAPQSEESVWHPEGPITVAWNVAYKLQEGMRVSVFVDGSLQATTSAQIIPVSGLERGEHTVKAELKDAQNRMIASAGPVTFFIRQPGLYNNRPIPTPSDGG